MLRNRWRSTRFRARTRPALLERLQHISEKEKAQVGRTFEAKSECYQVSESAQLKGRDFIGCEKYHFGQAMSYTCGNQKSFQVVRLLPDRHSESQSPLYLTG